MSKKKSKECANPLFEKWICEWRDEAAARNSKIKFVYNQALKSLRKYPLVLKSGREAKILEYFGDKICAMLDKKLENHRQTIGEITDEDDGQQFEDVIHGQNTKQQKTATTSKKSSPIKKTNVYIPKRRSGGFALLITLHRNYTMHDSRGFMNKSELIAVAQALCDTSFTLPEPGSYYTAWSSMASLIKKGLVLKEGNPPRYSLTATGAEIADKIMKSEATWDKNNEHSSQSTSSQLTSESTGTDFSQNQQTYVDEFTLRPGQFDIMLCVDNAETLGAATERKLAVQTGLRKNGVNFDVRKLHVGDFVWIAKEKVKPIAGALQLPFSRELVLDYIVERKRKDDLAHSIIDGRFREQKIRLKCCGLTRPIYLVEEYGKKDSFCIPSSSLQQAVVNTQIIDGFTIKNTKDLNESLAYLTQMTRQLQQHYSSKTLKSYNFQRDKRPIANLDSDIVELLAFDEFNRHAIKNRPLTVEETFAKQLMKVHGLSVDKVKAILKAYPTPARLHEAYSECVNEREGSGLLSSLKWGKSERNLGPIISQVLHQLYTKEHFP